MTEIVVNMARNEVWTASTFDTFTDLCREAIGRALVRGGPIVLRVLHTKGCYRVIVRPNDVREDVHQRLILVSTRG